MSTHPEMQRLDAAIEAGESVLTVEALLRILQAGGLGYIVDNLGYPSHVDSTRLKAAIEAEGVRCRQAALVHRDGGGA